ncbi:methyltransferase family protein [Haloactinospora alba]|uniref:Methyltransferase family protein n=1 Tax=Haloactinospora alba TaxID=405555 RepID=A0A543NGI3_9ACTN|nr:methyltransferase domain-containing protein [Haloactinospora alba]TQN30966.1 methyltransferase family protein [Haloactinospora alba]
MSATESTRERGAGSWRADPYTDALRTGHGPLFLRRRDGWMLPLEVERWCAGADTSDMSVLRRCEGSVLDLGCGPGRMVAALSALGCPTLGVDVSPAAVSRSVHAGGPAVCGSVFDPVPGEGDWGTALLLDGNIGIGGDVRALLRRVGELVAPEGLLLAEAAPVDVDERVHVRVDDGCGGSGPDEFPWARAGVAALLSYGQDAGWALVERWTAPGRAFVALRRAP